MRVPWTARRSSQSFLKEISPEYSLEGLMLKLKLQYIGHLMRRTDSFEKTLMLGKIEDGRKGQQRMRWLDGITDSTSVHGIFQARVLEWVAIAFSHSNASTSQSYTLSRLPWWLRQQRIHLQYRRPGFDSWVGKIPWRREWQPTPAMDRGAWQATIHRVAKSWTQLSD